MSDARKDYDVLIAFSTREEAEVAASALRADEIDAFVGNAIHANNDWNVALALGGLQVFVPYTRLADAKAALSERLSMARAADDGEAVSRRDRWKLWLTTAAPVAAALLAWVFR